MKTNLLEPVPFLIVTPGVWLEVCLQIVQSLTRASDNLTFYKRFSLIHNYFDYSLHLTNIFAYSLRWILYQKKKNIKAFKTPTCPACLQRRINENLIACFFRLWKLPDWLTRFKICCFWRVNYSWNAVCMNVVFFWVFFCYHDYFLSSGLVQTTIHLFCVDLYQLRSETTMFCLSDGQFSPQPPLETSAGGLRAITTESEMESPP